jgi:hypothetical protein
MRSWRQTILMNAVFATIILLTPQMTHSTPSGLSSDGRTKKAPARNKILSTTQPGMPIVWRDPGAVEKLDFVGGPGGRKRAPKPPFTFIEEDSSGTNPKIKVTDANGVKWSVKWGEEVNAEVFATRIAWAAGYFVEPSYFVASGRIDGAKKLGRAKKYVDAEGNFTDARFEMKEKDVTKLEDERGWRWDNNPLVGTREFNGLKIIMMLTSNWDNKDARDAGRGSNTAIFQYPVGDTVESRYVITDWGGSMGKWGCFISREKWDYKGYAKQTPKFTKGVVGGFVVWGFSGQHTKDVTEKISGFDVKWLLKYVGRISDKQIRAGLEASGATQEEIQIFSRALRDRIVQMQAL